MLSEVQHKTRACLTNHGGSVFVMTLHKLYNYFLNWSKCSRTYVWDFSPISLVDGVYHLDPTFRLPCVHSSTWAVYLWPPIRLQAMTLTNRNSNKFIRNLNSVRKSEIWMLALRFRLWVAPPLCACFLCAGTNKDHQLLLRTKPWLEFPHIIGNLSLCLLCFVILKSNRTCWLLLLLWEFLWQILAYKQIKNKLCMCTCTCACLFVYVYTYKCVCVYIYKYGKTDKYVSFC